MFDYLLKSLYTRAIIQPKIHSTQDAFKKGDIMNILLKKCGKKECA